MEIEFDELFYYNNTDNLQVLVLKGEQEHIACSDEASKYYHTLYEGPENTRTRRIAWSQGEWQNQQLLVSQFRPDIEFYSVCSDSVCSDIELRVSWWQNSPGSINIINDEGELDVVLGINCDYTCKGIVGDHSVFIWGRGGDESIRCRQVASSLCNE